MLTFYVNTDAGLQRHQRVDRWDGMKWVFTRSKKDGKIYGWRLEPVDGGRKTLTVFRDWKTVREWCRSNGYT